jgi:hypothetical protein
MVDKLLLEFQKFINKPFYKKDFESLIDKHIELLYRNVDNLLEREFNAYMDTMFYYKHSVVDSFTEYSIGVFSGSIRPIYNYQLKIRNGI